MHLGIEVRVFDLDVWTIRYRRQRRENRSAIWLEQMAILLPLRPWQPNDLGVRPGPIEDHE